MVGCEEGLAAVEQDIKTKADRKELAGWRSALTDISEAVQDKIGREECQEAIASASHSAKTNAMKLIAEVEAIVATKAALDDVSRLEQVGFS